MKHREVSLDIFRGIAVSTMILVNTPGSWSHVFAPLQHSAWHGITPTDLVFPFFLFAVGNSLYFTVGNSVLNAEILSKATKRSLLLFIIGLFLNAYPFHGSLEELRIMGVLQRIAICYLLAVILICALNRRVLYTMACSLPIVYWFLIGIEHASWDLNSNQVAQFDLALLGPTHMYSGFGIPFDPEGLLSTLGALPNVLFGFLTADYLSNKNSARGKMSFLLKSGTGILLLGVLWSFYLPVNKPLWSGSFALVSTGIAQLVLVLIIALSSNKGLSATMKCFEVYGSNPLFIYALAWIYAATLSQVFVFEINGQSVSVNQWLFELFSTLLPLKIASLLYAIIAVTIFYAISKWLYDRKIFIKV